jgi:hypothetical protein
MLSTTFQPLNIIRTGWDHLDLWGRVICLVLITIKVTNPQLSVAEQHTSRWGSYLKSSPLNATLCIHLVQNRPPNALTKARLVSWVLRHIIVLMGPGKGVQTKRSGRNASSSTGITAEPNTQRKHIVNRCPLLLMNQWLPYQGGFKK